MSKYVYYTKPMIESLGMRMYWDDVEVVLMRGDKELARFDDFDVYLNYLNKHYPWKGETL